MLAKIKKSECHKWWWQDKRLSTEVKAGLFKIEKTTKKKKMFSPYNFGIIVHVDNPKSECYFDPGSGIESVSGAGRKRIFDYIYGPGIYKAWITVKSKTKNGVVWRTEGIDLKILPQSEIKHKVITGFFQSHTTGQFTKGSSGLEVNFIIDTKENIDHIEWDFGKRYKKQTANGVNKAGNIRATHNIFKHTQDACGHVKVIDVYGVEDKWEFSILMTGI